jgi:hypothetical protein
MLIDSNTLKAVSLFAANAKDIRPALRGIQVQKIGASLRLTASNGHVLATTLNYLDEESAAEQDFDVIIPIAATSSVKGNVDLLNTNGRWSLGNTMFDPIDSIYPNTQRVWPTEKQPSGLGCGINPDYMALVSKTQKLIKEKTNMTWLGDKMVWECGPIRGLIMGVINPDGSHQSKSVPSF